MDNDADGPPPFWSSPAANHTSRANATVEDYVTMSNFETLMVGKQPLTFALATIIIFVVLMVLIQEYCKHSWLWAEDDQQPGGGIARSAPYLVSPRQPGGKPRSPGDSEAPPIGRFMERDGSPESAAATPHAQVTFDSVQDWERSQRERAETLPRRPSGEDAASESSSRGSRRWIRRVSDYAGELFRPSSESIYSRPSSAESSGRGPGPGSITRRVTHALARTIAGGGAPGGGGGGEWDRRELLDRHGVTTEPPMPPSPAPAEPRPPPAPASPGALWVDPAREQQHSGSPAASSSTGPSRGAGPQGGGSRAQPRLGPSPDRGFAVQGVLRPPPEKKPDLRGLQVGQELGRDRGERREEEELLDDLPVSPSRPLDMWMRAQEEEQARGARGARQPVPAAPGSAAITGGAGHSSAAAATQILIAGAPPTADRARRPRSAAAAAAAGPAAVPAEGADSLDLLQAALALHPARPSSSRACKTEEKGDRGLPLPDSDILGPVHAWNEHKDPPGAEGASNSSDGLKRSPPN